MCLPKAPKLAPAPPERIAAQSPYARGYTGVPGSVVATDLARRRIMGFAAATAGGGAGLGNPLGMPAVTGGGLGA